jgi:NAD(P)-dependent dehydrogenase (short-subunit alcohol dehydrogenase family)
MKQQADLLGLTGQVGLVTAAGSGIGRATALQLGQAGCLVAAVDLDGGSAQRTAADLLKQRCRAIAIEADATSMSSMAQAISTVRGELGPLDLAVNVVGGSLIRKHFLDLTKDDWERVLQHNLWSTALCCQHEAIAMIEDDRYGRIVNVASSSGIAGSPTIAPYGAAKAAVIHLTKSVAMELAEYGIRVNCVVPGAHDSERTRRIAQDPDQSPGVREFWEAAAIAPPLRRLGDPSETAGVAVFLTSALSNYVTGHVVISDGGILHTTARPSVGGRMRPDALEHLGKVPRAEQPSESEPPADLGFDSRKKP